MPGSIYCGYQARVYEKYFCSAISDPSQLSDPSQPSNEIIGSNTHLSSHVEIWQV